MEVGAASTLAMPEPPPPPCDTKGMVIHMKRKLFMRCVTGVPIGITIGYLITIFLSLVWGEGRYLSCVPELISTTGSEINAVIAQTILCGLLGIGFSAGSMVWEMENWSIVRQTGIYFIIASVVMMPVAYAAYWMEHSLLGFVRYFGMFVLIFIVVWMIRYGIARRNVQKLNDTLRKNAKR